MNTRVKNWTRMAAVCGMAVSAAALGGPPESLDRVPPDAAVTWVIPNVQGFVNDAKAFGTAVVPQEQQLQMNMGLAMVQTFLDMPGMNPTGSAAAVMYVEENAAPDAPPMVVLLPVADFAQLREGVGAQGTGPVYEANMGGGAFFMKDVGGGFVAVGPMAELVQEFTGAAGNVNTHIERMGRSGEQVLEGNDITMIANLEVLAPFIREGAEQMKAQMGMMMAMAGPEAQQAQGALEMLTGMMDSLAEDGQSGLVGLQLSPAGLSLDTGVQFKGETASANLFAEQGDTGDLLSHVPASNFMFAYALDTGNAGVSKAFETLAGLAAAAAEQPAGMNYAEMMKDASGVAGVMGSVPLMGAGLLSNVVTLTKTGNAAAMVETMKTAMVSLNGQSAQGMKYITSFEPAATEIAGVEVSRFAMNMAPDGSGQAAAFGPAQMIMPMLFGPQGGPNGFIAAVDGAVVQTLSQNTPLMEQAIKAARDGGGLGSGEAFKTISGRLPENRVFEFYMSIDQVMNAVGPMAATFGAIPGFEPIAALPPVGVGTAIGEGGLVNRIHVPNEVLAWFVEFGQQMQQNEMGGEDEGFEPDF